MAAFCLSNVGSRAQSPVQNDTNYYQTYFNEVTARIYLSWKYLKIPMPGISEGQKDIEYKANTKLNLGIGAIYHNLSLNVFYGFGFLNRDAAKGVTRGLGLQFHLYPPKWAIDLLGVFPKGYYLSPKAYASNNAKRLLPAPRYQNLVTWDLGIPCTQQRKILLPCCHHAK